MIDWPRRYLVEMRCKRITDQKGLQVTTLLRQMAFALVGMFSVIFVYKFGSDGFLGGGVSGGIKLVLLYMLVMRLTILVLVIWVGNWVIRRIGYRRSVMISLIISSLGLGLLAYSSWSGSVGTIVAAGVVLGVGVCGYWPIWYTLVPESEAEEKMGRAFGKLNLVVALGQVAAPLVAVGLIKVWGFGGLFLAGIGLLVASGVPMFMLPRHLHLDAVSWKEFGEWVKEAVYVRAGLAIGGKYINDFVYADLWPIYLLTMLGTITGLGWFKAGVLLAGAVFAYVVAIAFDKKADKRIQIAGVAGVVAMWGLRLIPKDVLKILVIDSIDRFFTAMSDTFFQGYAFRRAKGPEAFSFAVYRVVWESLFGVVVIGLLWWVLDYVGIRFFWAVVMMVGALGAGLSLLIEEHHRV